MRALGVEPPSVTPRVTEYMDEIVAFVRGLEDSGAAYLVREEEGDGPSSASVYFDTRAFEAAGHRYPVFEPDRTAATEAAAAEGDGEQGRAPTKRDTRDFALWKGVPERAAASAEEASTWWPSPWGPGRPGWHIECSAMIASLEPRVIVIRESSEVSSLSTSISSSSAEH